MCFGKNTTSLGLELHWVAILLEQDFVVNAYPVMDDLDSGGKILTVSIRQLKVVVEEVSTSVELLACQWSPDVATAVDAVRTGHRPPSATAPLAVPSSNTPHLPPPFPAPCGGVVGPTWRRRPTVHM